MIGTPIFVREVLQLGFGAFAVVEAFRAGGMLIGLSHRGMISLAAESKLPVTAD